MIAALALAIALASEIPGFAEAECEIAVRVVAQDGIPATTRILDAGAVLLESSSRTFLARPLPCDRPLRVEVGQVHGRLQPTFETWVSTTAAASRDETVTVELTVSGRRALSVRVEGPQGVGIPDIGIRLRPVSRPGPIVGATTGADGEVTVPLPVGTSYMATLVDDPPVESASLDGRAFSIPGAVPDEADRSNLSIVLSGGETVRGEVVSPDGTGTAGVWIHFAASDRIRWRAARTDPDGRFRGSVWGFPVELIPDTDGEDLDFEPDSMVLESTESTVRFVARPATARRLTVRLRTEDARRPPITTVVLNVQGPDGFKSQTARRASESGEASFPCPLEEEAEVRAEPSRESDFLLARWSGTIESCERPIEIFLKRGAVLEGVVTDDDGPASDRSVRASGARGTKTDRVGRFELRGLPPGTLRVATDPPFILTHASPESCAEPGVVEIPDRLGVVRAAFRLTEQSCVCARVAGSQPPAATTIVASAYRNDCASPVAVGGSAREGPDDESSCVCGAIAGNIHLLALDPDGWHTTTWWPGALDRRDAAFVGVGEGDHVVREFVMRAAGKVRVGPLESGKTITSVDWRISRESESPWIPLDARSIAWSRESQNELILSALPEGSLELRIVADGKTWTTIADVAVGAVRGPFPPSAPAGSPSSPTTPAGSPTGPETPDGTGSP